MSLLAEYKELFVIMVRNRVHERYHGSVLGVLWSLFSPLMTMAGLAIIFPLIAKFTMPDYMAYLLSGILVWTFMSSSCSMAGDSYLASEGLIKNVPLPRLLVPSVFVAVELVSLLAGIIAYALLALFFGIGGSFNIVAMIVAVLLALVFAMGLGHITAVAVVFFRDLKHILSVMLQALFYLSAVIFPVSILDEKAQALMEFNPFYHFVRLFHDALYFGVLDIGNVISALGIAVGTILLSLMISARFARLVVYKL